MKYLNYIFPVFSLLLVSQANSQQDPHFGLYKYNMSVVNPAYAGSNQSFIGVFGVRSQWVGIEGAPETFNLNINTPLAIMNNVGIGLSIIGDKVFVLSETHLYADFSYKIKINETLNLYAGIKGGISMLDVNLRKLKIDKDPLFSENVNTTNPNVGLGFYLKGDNYYINVSAPGLLKNNRYEKKGVVPVSATDEIHFFTGAGYDIDLNDNFMVRPSVLGKFVSGAPMSIDTTISVNYKKRLELGANYRIDESIAGFISVGFLNHLEFGYLYEKTITDVGEFDRGTHEVVIKTIF